MSWYRIHRVRIAAILMLIIVVGVGFSTPGQHLWLWIPLLLTYAAWRVDKRRRVEAEASRHQGEL